MTMDQREEIRLQMKKMAKHEILMLQKLQVIETIMGSKPESNSPESPIAPSISRSGGAGTGGTNSAGARKMPSRIGLIFSLRDKDKSPLSFRESTPKPTGSGELDGSDEFHQSHQIMLSSRKGSTPYLGGNMLFRDKSFRGGGVALVPMSFQGSPKDRRPSTAPEASPVDVSASFAPASSYFTSSIQTDEDTFEDMAPQDSPGTPHRPVTVPSSPKANIQMALNRSHSGSISFTNSDGRPPLAVMMLSRSEKQNSMTFTLSNANDREISAPGPPRRFSSATNSDRDISARSPQKYHDAKSNNSSSISKDQHQKKKLIAR